jgi:hypothetical protein
MLGKIASTAEMSGNAAELLGKLKEIAARGPVESMRAGPTGVGFTLESLLGIPANSKTTPDYKGIELKSERIKNWEGRTATSPRITLFSKSPMRGGTGYMPLEALRQFGYINKSKNRLQLYCSVDSSTWNSLGFRVSHEPYRDTIAIKNNRRKEPAEEVFLWQMEVLSEMGELGIPENLISAISRQRA